MENREQQTGLEINAGREKWESIRKELDETERNLTGQKVMLAAAEEKRESAVQASQGWRTPWRRWPGKSNPGKGK